jgi:hypothetical protein
MFNGRFGNEWSRVQQEAYDRHQRRDGKQIKRTGQRWQVQLIDHVWAQWANVWAERNQDLHGHTETERNEAIRRDVRRELEVVYQNRHLMEPSIQDLLFAQPEDHERQQLTTTRNWLAQNTPIFKESIRRAKSRALHNVRSIRTYFLPASGG